MDIQEVYKKYNYPSKQKLYALTKLEGVKATLKEVQQFLDKQNAQQIFSRKIKQKAGHIVSFQPDERFQMDLVDMSNFSMKNQGYNWILMLVDVFNRKIYAYLLPNKNKESIFKALTQFFEKHHPEIITSDNDTGFKSDMIKKLMEKNETINHMVEPNDHKALGIVDRAIQTIKNVIYKYMKQENTTSYSKELARIIKAYNDTPNSGILDIAPNAVEADKDNTDKLQILNHEHDYQNRKNRVHLNIGDTVRIRLNKTTFARSYDEKYSELQYVVTAVDKEKITLDDGNIYSSRRLIKTEPVVIPEKKKDKLTEAKKKTKVLKKLGKEHLEIDNKEYKNLPKTRLRK
jgi:hypothetical protein